MDAFRETYYWKARTLLTPVVEIGQRFSLSSEKTEAKLHVNFVFHIGALLLQRTPLHLAPLRVDEETCITLLEHGASINIADHNGVSCEIPSKVIVPHDDSFYSSSLNKSVGIKKQ